MIETLVPPPVVAVEAFADPPDAYLYPEEEALLTRAVAKRRHEFATARHCARQALATLGLPPAPLLPGERGAPRWPHGVVGSMTHCAGYRAAALGRATEVRTIGVDAEPHGPLPAGVLETIARPEELARLAELAAAHPDIRWDRLLFSAKESVYKAWYPLARRWLDFQEASLTVDPDAGTFAARLLVPAPEFPAGFAGRWLVDDGLVVTAIAEPAR
ncbi:MAG: 4'-phosphopantetheinyl transferase [Mycobacteriales bacterium]